MPQQIEVQHEAMQSLAICDLGTRPKFGLKGRDAEQWLANEGIDIPVGVYETRPWSDGGLIARFGRYEFFLEGGAENSTVESLVGRLAETGTQVYFVEHQEAAFLLTGSRSRELLAQTCGINFHTAKLDQVIFTRVAGVSCCVLPHSIDDCDAYGIWVDPSYAESLWDDLVEICKSLDGCIIESAGV